MNIRKIQRRGAAGNPRRALTLTAALFAVLGLMLAQAGQHQLPSTQQTASTASKRHINNMPRHSTASGRIFYGEARSEDDWKKIATGRLVVSPYDSLTMIRLPGSGVELSTDGGDSFDSLAAPFDDLSGVRFYFEANEAAHIYAQSRTGRLVYSDDAGESWTDIPLPSGFGVHQAPFAILNNGQTRLLLGNAAGLFVSTLGDDGDISQIRWNRSGDLGAVTAISTSPNQDAVAAGTASGVVNVTEDVDELNPGSWVSSALRQGEISVIEFDPDDPERIVAGFGSFEPQPNQSALYYTENGGRFWRNVAGDGDTALPEAPVRALFFDQDDESSLIYVVSASGVFVTRDLLTWSLEAGLPEDGEVLALGKAGASAGARMIAQTANSIVAAPIRAATVHCTFDVTPTKKDAKTQGESFEIKVNANSSTCAWSASRPASSSPLKIVSGASGRGDGKVVLSVTANTSTRDRTLTITIAGKRVTINQVGNKPSCTPQSQPGTASLDGIISSARQTLTVSITAGTGCTWKFEASPRGLTFSPSSGSGKKTVRVTVAANTTGVDRVFVIKIFGTEHRLTQKAAGSGPIGPTPQGCSIKAGAVSFSNAAGAGTLEVAKTSSCGTITLRSSASWLTLATTQVTQNGTVNIRFTFTSTTATRTASITASAASGSVSGGAIQIQQTAPVPPPACTALSVTLTPSSFLAAGGRGQLSIQSTGTCQAPTVTVDQPWVRVTMTSSTQGTVDVAANTATAARTALITVRNPSRSATGSPITVRQDGVVINPGTCTYSLSRTSIEYGKSSGNATLTVTPSRSDCQWTVGAVSTTSEPRTWARVSPASGRGTGIVTVTVDPPSTQGRVAYVQVAGVQVTIRQDGNPGSCQCTGPACGANMQMGISRSQIPAAGGDAVVQIQTLNSCEWDLTTTAAWVVFLDRPHGVGNGSVRIRIPANTGGARTAEFRSPQATPAVNGSVAHATVTQAGR